MTVGGRADPISWQASAPIALEPKAPTSGLASPNAYRIPHFSSRRPPQCRPSAPHTGLRFHRAHASLPHCVASLGSAAHSCTVRCVVYVAYMGRRSRQVAARRHERERGRTTRDRMARVNVSDETWSAFRAGLGATPASVALGRLVEREVASRRRRAAEDAGGVRQAVEDARVVVDELSTLIHRLERIDPNRAVPPMASTTSHVLFD